MLGRLAGDASGSTSSTKSVWFHLRDAHISFYEEEHYYLVDGKRVLESVTGLAARTSGRFKPNAAIRAMKRGKNWPRANYADVKPLHAPSSNIANVDNVDNSTPATSAPAPTSTKVFSSPEAETDTLKLVAWSDKRIRQAWRTNGAEKSGQGTDFHGRMERFTLGLPVELCADSPTATPLIQGLFWWKQQMRAGLRLFAAEAVLYGGGVLADGKTPRLAGSADLILFEESGAAAGDGSCAGTSDAGSHPEPIGHTYLKNAKRDPSTGKVVVHLKDYKNCSIQSLHKSYGKKCKAPMQHLPDCKATKWKLQINLLRHLLETHYDVIVATMSMVVCHEELEEAKEVWFTREDVEPMLHIPPVKRFKRKRCGSANCSSEDDSTADEIDPSDGVERPLPSNCSREQFDQAL